MIREEADYLIDKSMHTILQALQDEKAKKRRLLWFWAAIVWAAVAAAFALIITAKADRLHDGAAWGSIATSTRTMIRAPQAPIPAPRSHGHVVEGQSAVCSRGMLAI